MNNHTALTSLLLAPALLALSVRTAGATPIAFDDFDGINSGGFAQAGLGQWSPDGTEAGGVFTAGAEANVFRTLSTPITGGTVWFAVTMDVAPSFQGFAFVVPGDSTPTKFQYQNLGFDSSQSTDGLFSFTPSGIADTVLQTFLVEYNLDNHTYNGWAVTGDGAGFDPNTTPATASGAITPGTTIDSIYLTKGLGGASSPQDLVVDRLAIGRTADDVLQPVPEPATLSLLGLGLAVVSSLFRRRR